MISSIVHQIKYEIAGFGNAVQNREGLDKLAKLCLAIIEASQYMVGSILIPFKVPLKMFTEFSGSLNIINRGKDICHEMVHEKEKRKHRGALKITKLVTLTIGNGIETVRFFFVVVVNYGKIAARTYTLTLFRVSFAVPGIVLIKDLLIGFSAVLGIVINCKELSNPKNYQRELAMQYKIVKCESRLKWLKAKRNSKEEKAALAALKKFKTDYQNLIISDKELIRNEKNLKNAQIPKNEVRVPDDKKITQQIKICKWKIKTWKELKTIPGNEKKKAKISIINDIFKLVLISLSLSTLFISPLPLVPAFVLFGLLAGITGYRKFCFDKWFDDTPVSLTQKPHYKTKGD
jgi:hypothetical protein